MNTCGDNGLNVTFIVEGQDKLMNILENGN
jgi:hypothetical protein